uniref:transcriptional regulator LeuO n=1 Tax=Thaumasiovibrio occultus TaxID=1891184 RepID=UPI000B35A006|nr:transcriptional regulator LeuO [Thaumasiovibrio occultus]
MMRQCMAVKEASRQAEREPVDATLRRVDLNLLTVFDAVMQERNITRAASHLGMSQPAVSNAVSRLKNTFNDELFIRHGRGIEPTQRALELFGPIRQALQLVKNELPCLTFSPQTSQRTFKIALSSPADLRIAPRILRSLAQLAPNLRVHLDAQPDRGVYQKLRYQEIDFVIEAKTSEYAGISQEELNIEPLVVVASAAHPRLAQTLSPAQFTLEKHALFLPLLHDRERSDALYQGRGCDFAYQSGELSNVLGMVATSDLIAAVPQWYAEKMAVAFELKLLPLPWSAAGVTTYLTWHEAANKDKGHAWMRETLLAVCR